MAFSERTKSFVADTLALVIFFTIASGVNERFIAGMTWDLPHGDSTWHELLASLLQNIWFGLCRRKGS